MRARERFREHIEVAAIATDAVDANDDEAMNLSDVTYLVNYLFRQGPAPPPPSPPTCGLDPGSTILPVDCARGCP